MATIAKEVDMKRDFTRYPAGRFEADGPWNGQKFRTLFLVPAVKNHSAVRINLDSALSLDSSFLEEAFGGTIRELHIKPKELFDYVILVSDDISLIKEISEYVDAAHVVSH